MVKSITITPNMNHKDLEYTTSFLLDTKKKCSKCGGPNTMWVKDTCFDCTKESSKCIDCGGKCHYDFGGIYEKCKTCLGTDILPDVIYGTGK